SPFLSHRSVPPALPPLSLHDALPISSQRGYPPADPVDSHFPIAWSSPSNQLSSHARGEGPPGCVLDCLLNGLRGTRGPERCSSRSEEHTSELQSLTNLVCRLLLVKKK